jgi:hypothetical protein
MVLSIRGWYSYIINHVRYADHAAEVDGFRNATQPFADESRSWGTLQGWKPFTSVTTTITSAIYIHCIAVIDLVS